MSEKLSKETVIVNALGLHARPAAKIAAVAQNAKSDVWMIKEDEEADAKSIIDILTLSCSKGTEITVRISSPSDANVLDKIINLVESGFGE